jgi:hypothetical protein
MIKLLRSSLPAEIQLPLDVKSISVSYEVEGNNGVFTATYVYKSIIIRPCITPETRMSAGGFG